MSGSQTNTQRPKRGRPGYDAEQLLAVAVKVFTERGYDGTTMDDLSVALGISKSSIYHHVSGKEELLSSALDRALDGLEKALGDAVGPAPEADAESIARLEAGVRSSVRVLVTELPYVTLLLRVRGNTDVERTALARRRRIDAQFAELVAAAQRAGELRKDVAPQLVARLVFGTVNSLVEWYRPRRGVGPDALVDAVCAMVFDGLRPR
ncbi:MAG: TetR/AcrR family transcriptional regulator [Actinomycetota bacterium]|nr:TetR/AcrR family transcriptional regulator [Actinomycetota bacterium]